MKAWQRPWILALLAVGILLGVLVLRGGCVPSGPVPPRPAETAADGPGDAVAAAGKEDRGDRRALEPDGGAPVLRFLDILTGDPIPMARPEVVAGDTVLALEERESGSLQRLEELLARVGGRASWSYQVPWLLGEVRRFEIPCAEAPLRQDGTVLLPWQSGVRGTVRQAGTGQGLGGCTVRVHVFDAEALRVAREKAAAAGGVPVRAERDLAVFSIVYGLEAVATRETASAADGSYELALPVEGPTFVAARRSGYAHAAVRLEMEPGRWEAAELVLRPRPVLAGIVTAPGGEPLLGVEVTVGIHYGPTGDVDIAPEDGLGRIVGWDAGAATCNAFRNLVTDGTGRYEAEVPVAMGYSLLGLHQDAYGFTYVESPAADANGRILVDLHLERVSPGDTEKVLWLRWTDDRPVTGVQVHVGVADDPYGIQFPILQPDPDGKVVVPWLDPAVRYGFVLAGPPLGRPMAGWLAPGQQEIRVPVEQRADG